MSKRCWHWVLALIVASAARSDAQTSLPLATIAETETFTIGSDAVGADFKISVAYPFRYHQSDMRYPVLYVLDAFWTFGMATDIARVLSADQLVPPMLVVGIGYPGGLTEAVTLRARDMTLRRNNELEEMIGQQVAAFGPYPSITTGGAEAFLRFLSDELMPRIERDYRVDPSLRVLHGHSLGGTFVVNLVFREPWAFTHYIASAPDLVFDGGLSFRNEREYATTHDNLPANLFLAVGSKDVAVPGMVEGVLSLADTLRSRNYPAFEWELAHYEGETHRSVMPIVLRDALRHFAQARH